MPGIAATRKLQTPLALFVQEKEKELQAQLQAEQGVKAEVATQTSMLAQALKVRVAGLSSLQPAGWLPTRLVGLSVRCRLCLRGNTLWLQQI